MDKFDIRLRSYLQPSACEKIKFVFDKPLADGRTGIIAEIFHDRHKSIRLLLKKNQLIIKAPIGKTRQEIINTVKEKSAWIITNLNKLSQPAKKAVDSSDTAYPKMLTLEFDNYIFQDSKKITCELSFDSFKSLRLQIRKDKIFVRAPKNTSESTIIQFIKEKENWLRKKLQEFAQLPEKKPLQFGDIFWFLGKPFEICPRPKDPYPFFQGKKFFLPSYPDVSLDSLARTLQTMLATSILSRRIERISLLLQKKFGDTITYFQVKIHPQKGRWGSCSVKQIINLSSQLIAIPLPLIDYILVHELCHLRVMAHNARFHALVQQIIPDEQSKREEIINWEREHPRL